MRPHESNILNKIRTNYKGLNVKIDQFYKNKYLNLIEKIEDIDFITEETISVNIKNFTDLVNSYFRDLRAFSDLYKVKSQAKFESSFLEEISFLMFKDLVDSFKDKDLNFFNKGIYAGFKMNNDATIDIIKKDVDFCIGKEVQLIIEGVKHSVIMPIIAVEVKTYLDATMFGEVQYSMNIINSAVPTAKTFVLMGFRNLADEKIISAKIDSNISQMYSLRKDADSKIESEILEEYYNDIKKSLTSSDTIIPKYGKLFV